MERLVFVLALIAAPAAAQPVGSMEFAAKVFAGQAEACLLDVRDKGGKFETSKECAPLGAFHFHYIQAGGGRPETPAKIELIAEGGRKMAWMARAISLAGGGMMTVW